MALGAERASVLWLVLREVALMVGQGVAIGLPLAFALGRFVQSQLFALSATDPIALAAAPRRSAPSRCSPVTFPLGERHESARCWRFGTSRAALSGPPSRA